MTPIAPQYHCFHGNKQPDLGPGIELLLIVLLIALPAQLLFVGDKVILQVLFIHVNDVMIQMEVWNYGILIMKVGNVHQIVLIIMIGQT